MTLYHLNVTVHVLAALLWLGGLLFLALVGAPVLRKIEPPELRSRLFSELGVRTRSVAWIAIAVLIVTGVLNLELRGLLNWSVLGSSEFWSTQYGRMLAWKLAAVVVMVGLSALHDFVLGPRATRAVPGSPEAMRRRRSSALTARVTAVVGIVLVFVAVRLARGG